MKKGFTLIEMVATLLLVAILAVSVAISLLPMAQSLMQVRDNASTVQKARLAMSRMSREFTTITNVVAGDSHSISYVFLDPSATPHPRTLSWGGAPGDPLQLEGVSLSDDVSDFELRYYAEVGASPQSSWQADSRIIEVLLRSQAVGTVYTNHIVPRNILMETP